MNLSELYLRNFARRVHQKILRADGEFVRAFCKERTIACRIRHVPPGKIAAYAKQKGIGVEAAARFFRHKAFRAEALRICERTDGADVCILTAHTKNDLLETTLMRILRGCGPAGLAGMKTKSKEQRTKSKEQSEERKAKHCVIVRPLIDLSRDDVIAYLKAKGISWREDSTNADNLFLRNRIRNRLVPLLDEAFTSWRSGIDAMAETQSLAAQFIADEARRRIVWKEETADRCLKDQVGSNTKNSQNSLTVHCSLFSVLCLSTDEKNFFAQPPIVREEAVFQAVDTLIKNMKNPRSVKRAVVRRFCAAKLPALLATELPALSEGDSSVKTADFGVVLARRDGDKIYITRKRKEFFERGVSVLI